MAPCYVVSSSFKKQYQEVQRCMQTFCNGRLSYNTVKFSILVPILLKKIFLPRLHLNNS